MFGCDVRVCVFVFMCLSKIHIFTWVSSQQSIKSFRILYNRYDTLIPSFSLSLAHTQTNINSNKRMYISHCVYIFIHSGIGKVHYTFRNGRNIIIKWKCTTRILNVWPLLLSSIIRRLWSNNTHTHTHWLIDSHIRFFEMCLCVSASLIYDGDNKTEGIHIYTHHHHHEASCVTCYEIRK